MSVLKAGASFGFFFIGYALMLASDYIYDTLFTTLQDTSAVFYISDTLAGIIWVGIIFIWFIVMFLLPGYIAYTALLESKDPNAIDKFFAIAFPFFVIALVYFTWSWHVTFTSMLLSTLSPIFYWAMFIYLVAINVIGIPAYILSR